MRRFVFALALLGVSATALGQRAYLSGITGRFQIDKEGTWVFLTIDPSDGARSILMSAAGPGLVPYGVAGTLSDPQIEVWDSNGIRIAQNDNVDPQLFNETSYPVYARTSKDAGLKITLNPGVYYIHVTGVAGAQGIAAVDVNDRSTLPTVSSIAIRARADVNTTSIGLNLYGQQPTANINLALLYTGPNVPLANPIADPSFTLFDASRNTAVGTYTSTDAIPPTIRSMLRSPAFNDSHNAGMWLLWSYYSSGNTTPAAPLINLRTESGNSTGAFLFEIHNTDYAASRPAVVYVVPADSTVAEGQPLTLKTLVGGEVSAALWQRNGVDIPGSSALVTNTAMTLTYTKPAAAVADAGTYRLKLVTTNGATAYSPSFTVAVSAAPPSITAQPTAVDTYIGGASTLSVTATGSGNLYQWYKDGVAISGATAATYAISSATTADAGNYSVSVTNSGGSVISSAVAVTVRTEPTRLTNLSVRSSAGTGERTLILGYVLSGAGKPLVVRAIGPGLLPFGITTAMGDPRLGVFSGAAEILSNDNWSGDDGHAYGAFELPTGSKDSVIKNTFPAGTYTAQVSAATGATGEALIEVYDADPSTYSAKLINLSSRTQLDDGQRLIVGFTVVGAAPRTLVLRAVGPTLSAFNVATPHPDPRIELYNSSSTKIAENDDWSGDDGRTQGAFELPAGSKDSVLVRSFAPGGYTLHVIGAPATTGIVLVEIYDSH